MVLLILGMFMEPGAILTLMLPVLLPIIKSLNIDLVHFGVVMVLNLSLIHIFVSKAWHFLPMAIAGGFIVVKTAYQLMDRIVVPHGTNTN